MNLEMFAVDTTRGRTLREVANPLCKQVGTKSMWTTVVYVGTTPTSEIVRVVRCEVLTDGFVELRYEVRVEGELVRMFEDCNGACKYACQFCGGAWSVRE